MRKNTYLLIVAMLSAVCWQAFGAGALNWYATPETEQEIAAGARVTLACFEDVRSIEKIRYFGDVTALEQVTLPERVGGGKGLEISFEDGHDGKAGGRPALIIPLEKPVVMSGHRALVFWYHVSEEFGNFFFGRYDIRVTINGKKPDWSMPAVKIGWNQLVWDFEDVRELADTITSLRITIGPLLDGYQSAKMTIGPVQLVKTPQLPEDAQPGAIITESKSWAQRYVALKALGDRGTLDDLQNVLPACADDSMLIRSTAVDVMSDIAEAHGTDAIAILKKAMMSEHWRVRLATIKLINHLKDRFGDWAQQVLWQGLYDDCYYVREFCLSVMTDGGMSKAEITETLAQGLTGGDSQRTWAIVRILGEIGPRAEQAVPALVRIIRDSHTDSKLRCLALGAVWWIDEGPLEPEDWVLALALDPGEIHRHLLNKAMERLVAVGADAVPALLGVLKAGNPQLRCRALAVLRQIGPDAQPAQPAIAKIVDNDKWYVAYEADQALRAIDPAYRGSRIVPPTAERMSELTAVDDGTTTTISNGIIEMVFENGNDEGGPDIIRRVGGDNLVDGDWLYGTLAFKHSKGANILERRWLQKLWGSPIPKGKEDVTTEIVYRDSNIIDYMIKYSRDGYDMEYEYHYVLQKGRSGYYFYAVTRNVSGEYLNDGTSFSGRGTGRMAQLTAVTWGGYDYGVLHDNLKRKAAFVPSVTTYFEEDYPDIYQSAYRLPDGDLAAKHEWGVHELDGDVYGFAGLKNGGFWCIPGSFEFKPKAWPRNETGHLNNNLFLTALEGKYYIDNCSAVIDEDWETIRGPFLFYINDGENIEEMWADAKRQASIEQQAWPYAWLTSCGFQDRGTVRGRLEIDGDSAEGAYVVLSNPVNQDDPDQISLWMRNTGPYIYWTQLDCDGSYEIADVRTGSYGLYAFKPGVFGETYAGKITVENDRVTHAPDMLIEQQSEGELIWQIGIPDGGATEFKNGNNYHVWDDYVRYREDFPDDVHYVVGQSDWARDWNHMHPACVQNEWKPITWTIDFDLEAIPHRKGLLSIVCGGRSAKAQVFVNGRKVGDLNVSIGTQHVRTVPYGQLALKQYEVAPDILRTGKNTIEITFDLKRESGRESLDNHLRSWTSWLAYDFIRFEAQ